MYTGYQEMYNDFNDFEVEITVPNNFAVWGTGELENAEDVLNEKYYNRYLKALTSDEVINIIDSFGSRITASIAVFGPRYFIALTISNRYS